MKKHIKSIFIITFTLVMLFILSIASKAATVKVTADVINVRKGPSTSTEVVAMLSKDVECELLGEENGWYKVKYKKYVGYISKDFSEKIGDVPNEKPVENKDNEVKPEETEKVEETPKVDENENKEPIVNNKNSTIRKVIKETEIKILPLIYSNKIETLKEGSIVELITITSSWAYIQTEDISGWVRAESLIDSEIKTENNENNENSQNNQNIEDIKQNNNKEINPQENSFKEKTGYINEDFVNVRKGPSTNEPKIKVLTLNNEVTIMGEEGKWFKVKTGNDIGYISKDLVSDTKKVTSRNLPAKRQEINSNDKNGIVEEKNKETIKKVENLNHENSGNDVVRYAKQFLGKKYVYGGDGSNDTFDCSGFTMYVYRHFGVRLPHSANSQYNCGKGKKILKQSDLNPGDLVFLTDYSTGKGIGHCGIYLGKGEFIHASSTAGEVTISSFDTMYKGRFYSGLRIF